MKSSLRNKLKIRITADIDNKDISIPLLKIFVICNDICIDKLEFKKSNSKGYHLVIFTSDNLSKKKILSLRKYLGDDIKRIKNDKKRKNPKQYLFYKKINLPVVNIDQKI